MPELLNAVFAMPSTLLHISEIQCSYFSDNLPAVGQQVKGLKLERNSQPMGNVLPFIATFIFVLLCGSWLSSPSFLVCYRFKVDDMGNAKNAPDNDCPGKAQSICENLLQKFPLKNLHQPIKLWLSFSA